MRGSKNTLHDEEFLKPASYLGNDATFGSEAPVLEFGGA